MVHFLEKRLSDKQSIIVGVEPPCIKLSDYDPKSLEGIVWQGLPPDSAVLQKMNCVPVVLEPCLEVPEIEPLEIFDVFEQEQAGVKPHPVAQGIETQEEAIWVALGQLRHLSSLSVSEEKPLPTDAEIRSAMSYGVEDLERERKSHQKADEVRKEKEASEVGTQRIVHVEKEGVKVSVPLAKPGCLNKIFFIAKRCFLGVRDFLILVVLKAVVFLAVVGCYLAFKWNDVTRAAAKFPVIVKLRRLFFKELTQEQQAIRDSTKTLLVLAQEHADLTVLAKNLPLNEYPNLEGLEVSLERSHRLLVAQAGILGVKENLPKALSGNLEGLFLLEGRVRSLEGMLNSFKPREKRYTDNAVQSCIFEDDLQVRELLRELKQVAKEKDRLEKEWDSLAKELEYCRPFKGKEDFRDEIRSELNKIRDKITLLENKALGAALGNKEGAGAIGWKNSEQEFKIPLETLQKRDYEMRFSQGFLSGSINAQRKEG